MAQVFRAKSVGIEGFEKTVVIKRILPNLAREREFVEMFISEAKLAVSLTHPNIVQVFDLGRVQDEETGEESTFIAMELVDGPDLAEMLKRRIEKHRRAFPPALAAYIVAEVAKALDYAHRRRGPQGQALGLVHRDVSPQNVLISFEGDVKLTDFGIAKVRAARRRTEAGVLKGKYGYMAPEQVRGEPIDGRTDIFALGVVFYELLAGRRLFRGATPIETLAMIEEVRIPDPKETIAGLPDSFVPVLRRALSRFPSDRYASAAEMAGDLLALLFALGKPIQREELGQFARDLFDRGVQDIPQPIDASSLLEALSEKQSEPKIPEPKAQELVRQNRPTLINGPQETLRPVFVLAGPESGQGMVSAASPRAKRTVARYRGSLGFEGDAGGLVAFFGDHDDDNSAAERAVRCALELVALSAEGEEPRLAVVRSRVPERAISLRAIEVAAGPARSLAVKANPRQIILDEETNAALQGALPTVERAGGGASLDPEAARYIPPLSADLFIGRRDEVRALVQGLASAAAGRGQVAALLGPAGAGKTRLLAELKALLVQRQIAWFSGRCVPSLVPEPYHLLRDLFDQLAGSADANSPEERRERLDRLKLLTLREREIDLVYKLQPSTSGGALGERPGALSVLEVLVRVIDEVTRTQALVLVLEDLQWLDGPSRDVLAFLLELVPQKRLLLVATWRDAGLLADERGLSLSLPEGVGGVLAFPQEIKRVELPPLSEPEVAELGASLLGVQRVSAELAAVLWQRSSGNPFFVMELLRAYLEREALELLEGEAALAPNVTEHVLPATLEGILQDRLRGLSDDEIRALEVAAALGARVTEESLGLVLGDSDVAGIVRALVQRGLLSQAGAEYSFAHDLVREVFAERLSDDERRAVHLRLGESAEARWSEEKDARWAELAARHLTDAGQPGRAWPLWEAAGDARAASRDRGAFEQYRRALEARRQAGDPPALWLSLAIKAGEVLLARGDNAQGANFLDELARELPSSGSFDQLRGELALQAGDVVRARSLLDAAARHASRNAGASLPLARGRAALLAGDARPAVVHLSEAVQMARTEANPRLLAGALSALGRAYVYAKEPSHAEDCFAEAIDIAKQSKDTYALCRALLRRTIVSFLRRDFAAALEADREALLLAEAEGFESLAAHAAHYVGVDLVYLNDPGHAYTSLERSAAAAKELGLLVLSWTNEVYLGFLDASTQPDGPGLRRLSAAKDKLASARARPKLAQAYYLLGRAYLSRKSRFVAKRHFQEALQLAEEIGHLFLVGEIQRTLEEELDAG
jgi:serine/threonine protein kinase/tetratricopeptide (TPR) repeat protein